MIKKNAISLSISFAQVLEDYFQTTSSDDTKMKLEDINKFQIEILSNIENLDENDQNELSSIFENTYECLLDEYQQDTLRIVDKFETRTKHTQNNMPQEKEIRLILNNYYKECQEFIKNINREEQTRLVNSKRAIMNMNSEM